MNTSQPLPESPATYWHSTPVYYTSPYNTRHPCSSAPEDQPKRRVGCDAAVQTAPDGDSGVFVTGPKPFSTSVSRAHVQDVHFYLHPPACQKEDMPLGSNQAATPTLGPDIPLSA